MGGIGWMMGLFWLLILVLVVLAIAALAKHCFSSDGTVEREGVT